MTFDASEKSAYGAKPVECYRISQGETLYLFTNADAVVVIPQGTFTPASISNTGLEHSKESGAGSTELRVPRDSPLALMFATIIPALPVNVTIYKAHRDDLANAIPMFYGVVASVNIENSEAVLTCAPFGEALQRVVPLLSYQFQCNWPLYGSGCGLSSSSFLDTCTVGSVTGVSVVSGDFAVRADGWYRNGWLQDANGDVRFVVAHVGNTITLMNAFPALASGATVYAYPGCDRTEATCASKFNNLVNHLGFPRVPTKNPFSSSLS